MKTRIYHISMLLCLSISLLANTNFLKTTEYSIQAKFVGGYILPLSKNLQQIVDKPVLGGEVSIEFPSLSNHSWYHYWRRPTVGSAISYYNLGNNHILGNVLALYPYLLVPIVKNRTFRFDYRVGVGISFFDKTWNSNDTLSGVNAPTANSAIGSVVNAYITTGLGVTSQLSRNFALRANVDYIHMSNGSFLQPNTGINMFAASLSLAYNIGSRSGYDNYVSPYLKPFPYEWSVNVFLCGGARELYYKDNKMYPIGTLHVGATYQFAPFYAFGGGLDLFYDGVFVRQGTTVDMSDDIKREQRKHTHFNRYLIMEDAIKNKFRVGVCFSNEFVIGRVTALLDWGVYLYDPINVTGKIIYKYDIDKSDGWNYFRLGLRCRVWDNLFVQTSLKTHLQKAEFVEFGIGYQIPFTKRDQNLSSSLSPIGWSIYHHNAKYKRPTPLFFK